MAWPAFPPHVRFSNDVPVACRNIKWKDHTMYKPLILAACIAIAAPITAQASSDDDYGYARLTPETKTQIHTLLTEQGYDVRKIKMDDGYYEAYALKDGDRFEIYLDKDLNIVKTEIDD